MSTIKTLVNDASVTDFLHAVPDEKKRQEAFILLDLFSKITGEPAKMWGTSIVGFGQYHYKSERSRQEGDWMLTAFSPRKAALTLYVLTQAEGLESLVKRLGKYKRGSGCLYINKLADVDMAVLEQVIAVSYAYMKQTYATS